MKTILLTSIIGLILFVGCGSDNLQLGQPIPVDGQVIKLNEILAKPAVYNGKTVVLKGTISGQCPSYCEFFLKEGRHKVTIFQQGIKFPKLPLGKPVTILAKVTSTEQKAVFSAVGLQI